MAGVCQNSNMMKLQLFFLLFASIILSSGLQAQVELDTKQEKLLERLDVLDQQAQKKINQNRLAPLHQVGEGKTVRIQAAIMAGALLTDAQGQTFYTKRHLYVWGLALEDNPYLFLVTNDQGEVLYRTHTRYIVPIKNDLSLDPQPQTYQEVVHSPNRYTYDKNLLIEVIPSYGVESLQFTSAKSYLGSEGGQSIGQRLGSEFLFTLPFSLKPGLILSVQNGMGNADQMNYNYSALDLGAILKFKFAKHFSVALSAGKSLFFRANFEKNDQESVSGSYDSTFGGASLDYHFKNSLGKFNLTASYRLYQLRPAESYESIDANNRHQQNTLVGVYLGMPWEFKL